MKENEIRDEIFEYLMKRGVWVVRDKQFPRAMRWGVKPEQKGTSDIFGIYPPGSGKWLAVEVKVPGAKGRLSIEQGEFINTVRAQGGTAFVARSVEDVIAKLREVDNASL